MSAALRLRFKLGIGRVVEHQRGLAAGVSRPGPENGSNLLHHLLGQNRGGIVFTLPHPLLSTLANGHRQQTVIPFLHCHQHDTTRQKASLLTSESPEQCQSSLHTLVLRDESHSPSLDRIVRLGQ